MDPVKKTISTYKKAASKYTNLHSDISEVKSHADFFLESLNGNLILDMGCGPGRDIEYFSQKNKEVIGIDATPEFTSIAKSRNPSSNILLADIRNIKFQKESFDGIWACASLLHIPKNQIRNVIQNMKGWLKKDGTIFISLKEGSGEKIISHKGLERFFSFYSKDEVKNLLSDFKIVKIEYETNESESWVSIFVRKV